MAVSARNSLFQADVKRYWELLQVFVQRNLSARYRGSILGVFWSLLNPLTMTGLYTAVFGYAFSEYYNGSILRYALAAFTALIIVNFFSASTTQALTSIVANGALLNKIRLPVSVFPVSSNLANIFQMAAGPLPLLVIMTLVMSKSLLNVLALFLPLFALAFFSLGIGLFVSALYVFFRDLPYFYELFVSVLWISSPVFYPAKIVPAAVKPFLNLNPLSPIIESTRQIVLSGDLPDLTLLSSAMLSSIIVLGVGWGCFRMWRSQFMDLL
jgi:ABC-type polysaccharide/polyol phosphate export permease